MRRALVVTALAVAALLGLAASPVQRCSGTRHDHCSNDYPNELGGYAWYYRGPASEVTAQRRPSGSAKVPV